MFFIIKLFVTILSFCIDLQLKWPKQIQHVAAKQAKYVLCYLANYVLENVLNTGYYAIIQYLLYYNIKPLKPFIPTNFSNFKDRKMAIPLLSMWRDNTHNIEYDFVLIFKRIIICICSSFPYWTKNDQCFKHWQCFLQILIKVYNVKVSYFLFLLLICYLLLFTYLLLLFYRSWANLDEIS